jgi:hypothetical protein
MIDLNKEAEYHAHNYFDMHSNHYKGLLEGYVAGANSKYVEQRILEAQLEIQIALIDNIISRINATNFPYVMANVRFEIKEKLKELTK